LRDEGYLTNTLPVKKSSIVCAKLIASAIMVISSSIFVFLMLMIGEESFRESVWWILRNLNSEIESGTAIKGWMMILLVILAQLVQSLSYISGIFNALSIGYSKSGNKLLNSFVAGIIIYFIMQIISMIVMVSYFSSVIIYGTSDFWIHEIIGLLFITIILGAIFTLINYFMSVYMIEKKLNLE
jgi:hypothetical protein